MNYREALEQVAKHLLDDPDGLIVSGIEEMRDSYADLVEPMERRLADRQIAKDLKDLLRSWSESDEAEGKEPLPGLGLPLAIAVPVEGGFRYVRREAAVWADVDAGRSVRQSNVARATAKLDRYELHAEALRPYMEDPTATVAEAIEKLTADRGQA